MKKTLALTILLLLYVTTYAQTDAVPQGLNLIPNGNFEKGNQDFRSEYAYQDISVNPGDYSVVKNASNFNGSFGSLTDHTSESGYYLIADADGTEDKKIWCATIPVDPNSEYLIELWAANINTFFRNPSEVGLLINDTVTGAPYLISDANNNWQQISWQWLSGATKTATVCLINKNPVSDGNDLAIDDIQLIKTKGEPAKPMVVTPPVANNCPSPGDTISALVHFPFNESALTEFSKSKMETLLKLLTDCPAITIKIVAYTDMYGEDGYNDRLSVKRALEVHKYLIAKGVDAKRLNVQGLGERKLIYNGTSIEKNVTNRRVDFVIN